MRLVVLGLLYSLPILCLMRGWYFGALAAIGLIVLPYIKIKKISVMLAAGVESHGVHDPGLHRSLAFWRGLTFAGAIYGAKADDNAKPER